MHPLLSDVASTVSVESVAPAATSALLKVALVVALSIAVATVIAKRRARWPVAAALLLVALVFGAYFFVGKPSVHIASSTPHGSSSVTISGNGVHITDNRAPVVRPISDGDNSALRRALGTKETPKSAPPADPSPADTPKPERTTRPNTDKPPPDWTNRSAYLDGDTYYMVAKCGPINDPFWRESTVDMKMVATANYYIDEVLYRDRVAEKLDLDARFLREKCLVRQWPEPAETQPGDEVFVQMKFDKQFRDEIDRRYHAALSLDRAAQAGAIAGGVLAVLAGAYAFLRLSNFKPRPAAATSPTP